MRRGSHSLGWTVNNKPIMVLGTCSLAPNLGLHCTFSWVYLLVLAVIKSAILGVDSG